MKRKYIRILGVCVCLGLFGLMNSCTSEEELGKYPSTWLSYTLSVDPKQITVEEAINSTPTTLKVSSNTKWTVSTNSSWIHLSTTSGIKDGTVDVTCVDNTSTTESRTGTIIFRYDDDNEWNYPQVEVTQNPAIKATFGECESSDIGRYSFTVKNTYDSPYAITECGIVYSAINVIPTVENGNVLKCSEVPEDKTIQLTVSVKIESGTNYNCRFYVKSPLGHEYSEAFKVLTEGKTPDVSDNNKPQK